MIQLRDYQIDLSQKASDILRQYNVVYLAMEVRTGKTLTSLETARLYGAKQVLFITKKKAISSIKEDYQKGGFTFLLEISNYEQLENIEGNYDLIILDEAHKLGTYPKPNNKVKSIREKFLKIPKILLSGTPTPESFSQFFHQFFTIHPSPFGFTNFYKFANAGYVDIYQQKINGLMLNKYDRANYEMIQSKIGHLILKYTQEKAGFIAKIDEKVLKVKMNDITYRLVNQLTTDKVIESKHGDILANTGEKEMQKIHQIYSGTIKFEDGTSLVFDTSKAEFIKEYFKGKKIGIFYKFQAELRALKQIFGPQITDDLEEFKSTDKNIALQIVSGREGISLKEADFLVFYNIDFSAVSYWQARDRLTTQDRKENTIFWIFSENGIEEKIYNTVVKKKDYTLRIYKNE